MRRRLAAAAAAVAVLGGACARAEAAMPRCRPDERLAVVAQSVPGAAYLPCVTALPTGWSFRSLDVDDRGTRLSLRSDRADRPVQVTLAAACDIGRATPVAPRAEGVRTYQRVLSIAPTYRARLYDVFPGGCVAYEFDFERGSHIALTDELQQAVALYSRRQLRQELREHLGVRLDP